jgi:hypothetical protein
LVPEPSQRITIMAGVIDPATTTMIDHIMAELELLN